MSPHALRSRGHTFSSKRPSKRTARMQRHPLHVILSRPAIHLLLGVAFAVAFFCPIFAMTRPTETFHFLYLAWLLSLVALFAISRVLPAPAEEAPGAGDEVSDDEVTRGMF